MNNGDYIWITKQGLGYFADLYRDGVATRLKLPNTDHEATGVSFPELISSLTNIGVAVYSRIHEVRFDSESIEIDPKEKQTIENVVNKFRDDARTHLNLVDDARGVIRLSKRMEGTIDRTSF